MAGVQDTIFNLSLRMLGTISDAEDATRDMNSRNYLIDYKKSMPAHYVLDYAMQHKRIIPEDESNTGLVKRGGIYGTTKNFNFSKRLGEK